MRSLLRSAAVALGALAALAVVAAPASAQSPFPGTEVTIFSPKGAMEHVWLNEIEVPENYGTYPIRDRNGPRQPVIVEKGYGISLRPLLEEAGRDLGYGTVEIERRNGTTLRLTKDAIDDPNYSPTLYVDAGGEVWFLRPSRGSTDYNAVDHFRVGSAAIHLRQTAATREVSVKASRKRIEPGESVTFEGKVTGGPDGARYTYKWNFNDGTRIADGRLKETHRFAEAGRYEVLLSVKLEGESRSDSGVAVVQVGDPKQSDKDRAGGGDNATGTGDSGTATGDAGAGTTYGTDDPTTYTPVTPPAPAPAPEPTEPTEPDVATAGTPVAGNLLADAGADPPSNILEAARRAARDGTPRDDDPGGAGVPEAALSIAGVLALLGLGAGIETRQGRLPRPRLPRRAA